MNEFCFKLRLRARTVVPHLSEATTIMSVSVQLILFLSLSNLFTALHYHLQHNFQAKQYAFLCSATSAVYLIYLGVYVASVFTAAFAFGIGFDSGVTAFWDSWNRGVSVLIIRWSSRLIPYP